jgi:hypothetical protein
MAAPISQPATAEPLAKPVGVPASATRNATPMTDTVWAGLANGTFNGKKYLGVPQMTPEEKALVAGVYEDGSFEWRVPNAELMRERNPSSCRQNHYTLILWTVLFTKIHNSVTCVARQVSNRKRDYWRVEVPR